MKALIHFPIDRVAPTGGPAGYLYNLRQGLEEIGVGGIDFLPAAGAQMEKNALLRKVTPDRVKDLRRARNFMALPTKSLPAPVGYSAYDAIHFHSTEDLYVRRGALESYRGKVLLTSHSPLVYHKELIGRLNPRDAKRHSEKLANLEVIDHYAFERADIVVFPCPEAEEPYFNTWGAYPEVRDEAKLRYLPTGIRGCAAKASRGEVRARYGIPGDAFLMCYVGRHNSVKGYDALIEATLPMLDDPNVWMLVAGKQGPLFAPEHSRWVEAGWTDDPHSLIAAADVFVLPNKETYFDLVLLEVLSLGTPLVATRTGGNRYFDGLSEGIVLCEGAGNFAAGVRRVREAGVAGRVAMAEENRRLFAKRFTCGEFARSYCELLEAVTDGGVH